MGLVTSLAACSSNTVAVIDMVKATRAGAVPPPANPQYAYLRAQIGEREVYLVLGYVDATPQGPLETWYSSAGEVLQVQNGRVVGASGLPFDWRNVQLGSTAQPLPSWADLLAVGPTAQAIYPRQRDLMPGYVYGMHETITVRAIPSPTPADGLSWFEERTPGLPPARFGLQGTGEQARVMKSEQCLAPSLCLILSRFTPPAVPTLPKP